MLKIRHLTIFLAAVMLFVLSACQSESKNETMPDPPATAAASSLNPVVDQRSEAIVPQEGAEPSDEEEAYAALLGEYRSAMEQQWDSAALMDHDLNYMIAGCYGEEPLKNLGYAVTDLDGDGTPELLIGALTEDASYGRLIFALYTLKDGEVPQLVFDSSERSRYYYAGENRFANLGAGAYDERFETTVKFEDGELIDMTYTTDPEDYMQMELTMFSEWIR